MFRFISVCSLFNSLFFNSFFSAVANKVAPLRTSTEITKSVDSLDLCCVLFFFLSSCCHFFIIVLFARFCYVEFRFEFAVRRAILSGSPRFYVNTCKFSGLPLARIYVKYYSCLYLQERDKPELLGNTIQAECLVTPLASTLTPISASLIRVGHFNHSAATLSTLNNSAQRAARAQVKPYTPPY